MPPDIPTCLTNEIYIESKGHICGTAFAVFTYGHFDAKGTGTVVTEEPESRLTSKEALCLNKVIAHIIFKWSSPWLFIPNEYEDGKPS